MVPAANQAAELYNLSKDISELKNLAEVKPEVVRELEKKYADWSQQMTSSNFPENTETNEPLPIDTDTEGSNTGP